MSYLENLPNLALICIFENMMHEDKLSLRQTSRRMFDVVTALDPDFKYWTFDPSVKEDLPDFVLDSEKLFQIHIDKNWEDVEKDNEDFDYDSDEEDDEEVQKTVQFITKFAHRIVSFKLSCTMNWCDDGFALNLEELADLLPKWKNLKSFSVINTVVDLDANQRIDSAKGVCLEDLAKILEFCQNSLEKLVLVGLETCRIEDLQLKKLKSLVMIACSDSEDFLTSFSLTGNFSCLEKIIMTNISEDVNISDFLSADLSQLKSLEMDHVHIDRDDDEPLQANVPNLRSIKLKFGDSAEGIEEFLILCSPTLECLDIESGDEDNDTFELNFKKLADKSWKIKELKLNLTIYSRCLLEYDFLEDFLNSCPSLEKLILESGGNYGSDNSDDQGHYFWENINELKGNVLNNFSLKYLSCPTYYLRSFSSNSCEQVSELHLQGLSNDWNMSPYCINYDDQFEVCKFPALNSLTLKDTSSDENRILVSILFERAQVKESTRGYFSDHKYERAFLNSPVSSAKSMREPARNLLITQKRD